MQESHCPFPPGSEAVRSRSPTARCPQAVRQCIAEVALPTTPRPWGTVSQEFHCPLPLGSEIVYCRSCTAHCPRQWGSALHEFHCPLTPRSEALHCRSHYGVAAYPLDSHSPSGGTRWNVWRTNDRGT